MSATYNWSYRPGVANKYGLTIPAGADNVKPSEFVYVALFGNDATGNGSRQLPYRTVTKAVSLGSNTLILGAGVYREASVVPQGPGMVSFVGDGEVVLDASYNGSFYEGGQSKTNFVYNVTIKGDGSSYFVRQGGNVLIFTDCAFLGATIQPVGPQNGSGPVTNCVFANISPAVYFASVFTGCTFLNCNNLDFNNNNSGQNIRSCLFKKCNIAAPIASWARMQYNLFYQCNYKLTTSSGGGGGALYPGVPGGYSYYNTLNDLNAAYTAAGGINGFIGCAIGDPLFNNESIGDFTLAFNSPAKNLSYFGTFVGAKSIAYSIKVNAMESSGGFEFAGAVNLTINDDSITLTDPSLDAQIDTKVILNILGREIASLPSYGFSADRNGQYIDSIPDLDTVTRSSGNTLIVPASYLVETGAITYNGNTYQPGQRFTTVTGQTSFTSVASGVVREILEAPQRHTVMARFSDGGVAVTAGDALVAGNYYFVQTGSVSYNSALYDAGQVFKATDNHAFSGSGAVIIAFAAESFQHYELGRKPTSNNIGDARTGTIIRGNGDPAYDRGGLGIKEFPVNAKFIQIRYIIKTHNLKP